MHENVNFCICFCSDDASCLKLPAVMLKKIQELKKQVKTKADKSI